MGHLMNEVFNSVKGIIMKLYPEVLIEEAPVNASLKHDLGFDSLNRLEIVMEFEKIYGISINEEILFQRAKTFDEFCSILGAYLNEDKKLLDYLKRVQDRRLSNRIKEMIQRQK